MTMAMMANPTTDEGLVPRLRAGDEEAVRLLLQRHWRPAFQLARRAIGDPGLAEDAAQEAFCSALRSIDRFEDGRALRPWLYRIVRNVATDHARARSRRTLHEESAARPDVAGEANLDRRELLEVILARLAPFQREVLTLHFLHGLTHREVADVVDRPEGTVSAQIHRALASLRERFAGEGGLATASVGSGLAALLAAAPAFAVPEAPSAVEVIAGAGAPPPGGDATPPAPSARQLIDSARGGPRRALVAAAVLLPLLLGAVGLGAFAVSSPVGDPDAAAVGRGPDDDARGVGALDGSGDDAARARRGGEAPDGGRAPVGPTGARRATGAAPVGPGASSAIADDAGAVRGRVFLDGQPEPGVHAILITGGEERVEVTTGADGRFAIPTDEVDDWRVARVVLDVPAPPPLEGRSERVYGRTGRGTGLFRAGAADEADFFVVVAGPTAPGSAGLELHLIAQRFAGRVIDATTEAPLPGARVLLLDRRVDVDDDGRFELVAPRIASEFPTTLVASADGYAPSVLQVPGVHDGLSWREGDLAGRPSAAAMRRFTREQHGHPDFVKAAPVDEADVLVRLAPELILRGVVRDGSGLPVAGASVGIRRRVLDQAPWSSGRANDSEVLLEVERATDAEGYFELPGLTPGGRWGPTCAVVSIAIEAAGFAPVERNDIAVRPDGRALSFVLDRASELAGRVVGPDGPIEGAWIFVLGSRVRDVRFSGMNGNTAVRDAFLNPAGSFHAESQVLRHTDADGAFSLGQLASGEHRLLVGAAGFAEREVLVTHDTARAGEPVEVALVAEATISGRFDQAHRVLVVAFPAGHVPEAAGSFVAKRAFSPARSAAIANEGRFVLRGLQAGRWDLFAEHGSRWAALARDVLAGTEDLVVELPHPDDAEAPPRVRLRAVDAAGEPLSAWLVLVRDGASGVPVPADGSRRHLDGEDDIELPRVAGGRLHVSADGHAPVMTDPFSLRPGMTTDLGTIALPAGGASIEVILAVPGEPVAELLVSWRDGATGVVRSTRPRLGLGAEQRVILRGLAAGTVTVWASWDGGGAERLQTPKAAVEVGEEGRASHVLDLSEGRIVPRD